MREIDLQRRHRHPLGRNSEKIRAFTRILRGLFLGLDAQAMSDLDEPQGVVFRVTGSQVVRLDP